MVNAAAWPTRETLVPSSSAMSGRNGVGARRPRRVTNAERDSAVMRSDPDLVPRSAPDSAADPSQSIADPLLELAEPSIRDPYDIGTPELCRATHPIPQKYRTLGHVTALSQTYAMRRCTRLVVVRPGMARSSRPADLRSGDFRG